MEKLQITIIGTPPLSHGSSGYSFQYWLSVYADGIIPFHFSNYLIWKTNMGSELHYNHYINASELSDYP